MHTRWLTAMSMVALASVSGSAIAAAGPRFSFNGFAGFATSTNTWTRSTLVKGSTPATANFITYRIKSPVPSGGNAAQTLAAFTAAGTGNGGTSSSGPSATANFPASTTIYSGTPVAGVATPSSSDLYYPNNAFGTAYPGGTAPLVLWLKNSAGTTSYTPITVTVFQSAIADATGTVESTDPTFTRPGTKNSGAAGTASSSSNTSNFDVVPFHVPTSGVYFLSLMADGPNDVSGAIYEGSFSAGASLSNVLRAGQSSYSASSPPYVGGVVRAAGTGQGYDSSQATSNINNLILSAGVQYYYVVSSGSTSASVPWSLYSEGPANGSITIGTLPEPTTLALMAGVGLVGLRRRSR